MARIKKPTPKKKKTLIPEPKWDKLCKAKTEEERLDAWQECDAYVHGELTDRERLHSLKKFINIEMGYSLTEINVLPDTYLNSFAKHGWKYVRLGYMPDAVRNSLVDQIQDLIDRRDELREKMFYEPTIHQSVSELEPDHKLSVDNVKTWISAWKNSSDPTSKQYVSNMQTYLKTGVWLDTHYGLNREYKSVPICVALSYDHEGLAKRTKGVYYPDLGIIWK